MATLMPKEALIEAIAQVQAIISRRTEPNAPRNDDQCFLSDLREELYSCSPDEIDYPKKIDEVINIKNKYDDLPIHSYYL